MNTAQLPNGGEGVGGSWEGPRCAVDHQRILVGHVHSQGRRGNPRSQVGADTPRRKSVDEFRWSRHAIGAIDIRHQEIATRLGNSALRNGRIQLQALEHLGPAIVINVGVELPVALRVGINQTSGLQVLLRVVHQRVIGHPAVRQVNLTHRIETHLDPVAIRVATRSEQSIQFTSGDDLRAARHRVDAVQEGTQSEAGIDAGIPGRHNPGHHRCLPELEHAQRIERGRKLVLKAQRNHPTGQQIGLPQIRHPERASGSCACTQTATGVVEALIDSGVARIAGQCSVRRVHQVFEQVALDGPALEVDEVQQAGRHKTVVHNGEDQPVGDRQGQLRHQAVGTSSRQGERSDGIVGLRERENASQHRIVDQSEGRVGVERRNVFLGIPTGFVPGVATADAYHIAHLDGVIGPGVDHRILNAQREVRIDRLRNEQRLTQGLRHRREAGVVEANLSPVGGDEPQRSVGREGLQVRIPTLGPRRVDDLEGVLAVFHHTEGAQGGFIGGAHGPIRLALQEQTATGPHTGLPEGFIELGQAQRSGTRLVLFGSNEIRNAEDVGPGGQ